MLGFTLVRKAAKYGYRKFGIPGAIVGGLGGLFGYRFLKKRLTSSGGSGADNAD